MTNIGPRGSVPVPDMSQFIEESCDLPLDDVARRGRHGAVQIVPGRGASLPYDAVRCKCVEYIHFVVDEGDVTRAADTARPLRTHRSGRTRWPCRSLRPGSAGTAGSLTVENVHDIVVIRIFGNICDTVLIQVPA